MKKIIVSNIILIKLFIVVLFSLFVAFIGATLFSNNIINNLKNMLVTISNQELILDINNFLNNGYKEEGENLLVIKDDPSLEIQGIDIHVGEIKILFSEALADEVDIQVYYTIGKESFNVDDCIYTKINKGEYFTKISLNKNITSLRIDIGNYTGELIPLENVTINEKINLIYMLNLFKETVHSTAFKGIWNDRFVMILLVCVFLCMHFIVNVSKMYTWIWNKRWLVGGIALLFLVVNKYHGDSMSIYDRFIQPGLGNEYIEPVFGVPRQIRSDEWVVTTPSILAGHFGDNPYSKYNSILRGTNTLNIVTGISRSYAGVSMPHKFLSTFLPIEYGFSFMWYSQIIFTLLVSMEFCYLIGKNKRLLAAVGGFLITCSSFYVWWGFPLVIASAEAAIVGINFFIESNIRFHKIIYGIGVAIAGSCFVTTMYPPWQIPLGYVFLGILIWLLYTKRNKLKEFNCKDWIITGFMVFIMLTIIFAYLFESKEYIQSILNTIYPGNRRSNGDYGLDKLFYYFISPLLQFKNFPNQSEAGTFISFFPLPLIAGLIVAINNKKNKMDNVLLVILLCMSTFLLIYVTTGLPTFVSNLSLMSRSFSARTVDIIGIVQIYILVILFAQKDKLNNINPIWGLSISGTVAVVTYGVCQKYFHEYFSKPYAICMFLIITLVGYSLLSEVTIKMLNKVFLLLILISIFNALTVRPIVKGLDSFYSKPVAKEINHLIDYNKNSKWLGYGEGISNQSFLVACGAPTINFVNTYPNMALWTSLDPDKKYEEIYNRYAHIAIIFTEADTSFETIQGDYIRLNLSYRDIEKTQVNYIFSSQKLDINNQYVQFALIYSEAGSFIYEVIYK